MKANELRIGNYVYHKHSIGMRLPAILTCRKDIYLHDELEPIPLTEEWLIKFGFRHVNKNWYNIHANGNTFNVYLFISEVGYRVEIVSQSIGTFKYVHQLQNLYFALTNTELNND